MTDMTLNDLYSGTSPTNTELTGSTAINGSPSDLNESERRTLRRILTIIRSARAAAANGSTQSGEARVNMYMALHYLMGFLDGKGLISNGVKPGYANLFGDALPKKNASEAIDDVIAQIESILEPTRSTKVAGGIFLAVGVALKVLGDWLKED